MGRAKKYLTPEQKADANRAKSRRHYEKKKDKINNKRRREYHKAKAHTDCAPGILVPPERHGSALQPQDPLHLWMEQNDRIKNRLLKITGKEPAIFVDEISLRYLSDGNKDTLHTHATQLGKLQKAIYRCQNEVLTLAGMGPEYHAVDKTVILIRTIVGWVEEVLCYAMVELSEVRRLREERGFMYQIG
ncbi:hypothetical protein NLJ89_g10366 [Agrocybe chaxingu]|uniref:Uncharacterized protein n=1 Tax=Agrocybe chaxingu TaxID=84603 RepID=A0A9W8JQX2_9AGAR|nr:hypothetical protein NLJ89_g10366 [Agrocybe chaxingu]